VSTVGENLGFERWRKLVWNIPFNGLRRYRRGSTRPRILADEQLRAAALALMDEVIAGANACGYALPTALR
jgi:2-dehydropantoate 2-reductase